MSPCISFTTSYPCFVAFYDSHPYFIPQFLIVFILVIYLSLIETYETGYGRDHYLGSVSRKVVMGTFGHLDSRKASSSLLKTTFFTVMSMNLSMRDIE